MKEDTKNTRTGGEVIPNVPAKKIKIPGFLASSVKNYPGEKQFHVTSDGMVFLDKEENLALAHQRTLKKGEVQTIKVK